MRTDLKKYMKEAIGRTGFELRRVSPPREETAPSFYGDVSPTCQIPYLGWIYELYFGPKNDGVFVEIGAFDGWSFSNTSCLASAGWSGHYVEAVQEFAALCRERYAGNPHIKVHECAIGAKHGAIEIVVGGSLSSSDKATVDEYKTVEWAAASFNEPRTITVDQTTLDDLLPQNGVEPGFDVLVVDVEGYEAEVFAGFDIDWWRPSMLIVELTDAHPDLVSSRRSHAQLMRDILGHGYCVAFKDCINTIFVTEDAYSRTYGLTEPAGVVQEES